MKTKKQDFPKKLYVFYDGEGQERFLVASETPDECATLGEDKLIGIYTLDRVARVLTSVVLVAP